jgi:hypothetical protein
MDTKPGWKTTEFWLSFLAILAGAVMASGILDSLGNDHWAVKAVGLIVTILSAIGYTAQRGIVKASTVKANSLKSLAAEAKKDPR